jgi:hypothetical protein
MMAGAETEEYHEGARAGTPWGNKAEKEQLARLETWVEQVRSGMSIMPAEPWIKVYCVITEREPDQWAALEWWKATLHLDDSGECLRAVHNQDFVRGFCHAAVYRLEKQ